MLSSANYRVSQQQKEIKFVHDKIKEFMRKHQQHLPSQVFLELDVIVHSSDYNSKDNAMYQPPKNEYDANVQLEQILEEQERYNQLLASSGRNRGHARFKSQIGLAGNKPVKGKLLANNQRTEHDFKSSGRTDSQLRGI